MTDELAVLLRKAAEKWPEKFDISLMGTVFALSADNSLPGFYIRHHDRLNEPENLTLDHMDAIAGAVGMRFTVNMDPQGKYWWAIWNRPHKDLRWYVQSSEVHGDHPDKRSASLAALCAILKYKLENP